MNKQQTPVARRDGLVVRKLKDEILIYDIERHQAHCLNLNAASIWEGCDGNQTIKDLSSLIPLGESVSEHEKEQIVWIALDQLEKTNLLNRSVARSEVINGISRRQLMKVIGITALIVVPVVSTIVAPTAAHASTCLASGQGCGVSSRMLQRFMQRGYPVCNHNSHVNSYQGHILELVMFELNRNPIVLDFK